MADTPILRAGTRTESIAAFPTSDSPFGFEELREALRVKFCPVTWLANFELVGGGWIVRDCLSLAILVEGRSDAELSEARQMITDLTPENREAIVDHLRGREVMEAGDGI